MRELSFIELAEVSGAEANGPVIAAAGGAAIAVVGYIGTMAGSGQSPTMRGGVSAAATGAVAGAFVPLTIGPAVGGAVAAFYGGLAGGYVMRESGGDSGR